MTCPICLENELTAHRPASGTADPFDHVNECPRCGKFIFPDGPDASSVARSQRYLASAYTRRQNQAGQTPRFSWEQFANAGWWTQFERMGIPRTVPEKLDALLRLFASRTSLHGDAEWVPTTNSVIADLAPVNDREVGRLVNLLAEQGFLEGRPGGRFRLTAKGYSRLSELEGIHGVRDTVFLAMWFSAETAPFRAAAVAGIVAAGYRPVIVDQIEYTGFIVDRILTSIRESRCVIADFTAVPEDDNAANPKVRGGARGGVYWEAGYGFGLEKPVIHTCRADDGSRRRTHFDIEQYSTIFWKDDELEAVVRSPVPANTNRLAERLFQRLLAVAGRGPGIAV